MPVSFLCVHAEDKRSVGKDRQAALQHFATDQVRMMSLSALLVYSLHHDYIMGCSMMALY